MLSSREINGRVRPNFARAGFSGSLALDQPSNCNLLSLLFFNLCVAAAATYVPKHIIDVYLVQNPLVGQ